MNDIYHNIFVLLNFGDIHNCMKTCKQFYDVINKEIFWMNIYNNKYLGYNVINTYYETCRTYLMLSKLVDDINDSMLYYKLCNNTLCPHYLDKNYDKLLELKYYNLSLLNLCKIPNNIYLLKSIVDLRFNDNIIVDIPKELFEIKTLRRLYLYNNKIRFLSYEIGKLTNLEILDMINNELEIIPDDIGFLTKLNALFLRHNKIKSIPSELGLLSKLSVLDLRDNKIMLLPKEIKNLSCFRNIWLDDYVRVFRLKCLG